jgi:hypothetical protein
MATFTPPAEPAPSGWDHFWLRRPVPEDSVVWTDKTYPYGTTKGGVLRPHHGVEFNIPAGTQVMSTASGTVVMAGNDSDNVVGAFSNFYGNVIVLQLDFLFLGRPVFVVYGHLSEVFVAVGQQVGDYEVLGLSGATGIADGPHLHFEVRVGENSYELTRNPLLWLYPFSDRGAVAGRISWPDGSLAREVPVSLRRVDAPSAYSSTTSYADDSVNSDDNWKENFVLDDVAAGYYVLTVGVGDQKVEVELWVYPYQTSFTEIVLSG